MTEETSPTKPSPPELVANPEFIKWYYPPYCELCNVTFTGESPSQKHFEGINHKNRLQTWKKYQNSETRPDPATSKTVLCDICWKEMNTQLILDTHNESKAHLKEVKGRSTVQRLKEEYRQLKESLQQK